MRKTATATKQKKQRTLAKKEERFLTEIDWWNREERNRTTNELQDIEEALNFAKARSFEVIDGMEDYDSVGQRVFEVYERFFQLPAEDRSTVMRDWWDWLSQTCNGESLCINCRKGLWEIALGNELFQ